MNYRVQKIDPFISKNWINADKVTSNLDKAKGYCRSLREIFGKEARIVTVDKYGDAVDVIEF